MNDIVVSILCTAYNHEKYIRSALDGFVKQKTSFPYEIIIHDDASTDGTQRIIREYEEKYPQLIKSIYQKDNQYSRNISITKKYMIPLIRGKYVAICEGDDYWTDPLKLEKQVKVLEENPYVDICTHRAATMENGTISKVIAPMNSSGIIPVERVISGGGNFVATCSIMVRSNCFIPETPMSQIMRYDYLTQIQGSLRGGMYYLNDCMSVYRLSTESSWTVSMRRDTQRRIEHSEKTIRMLKILNEYTERTYENTIQHEIRKIEFMNLFRNKEYQRAITEYKDIISEKSIRFRIKAYYLMTKQFLERSR